jgi:hypothetical protein
LDRLNVNTKKADGWHRSALDELNLKHDRDDPRLSDKFRKPVEKGALTGEDFLVRKTQIEPFRAVDFRKGLQTATFRRQRGN